MQHELNAEKLTVRIYEDRKAMGEAAAADIARAMEQVFAQKDGCNIIFAAAPSQNEVLAALSRRTDLPWERVTAFHMDEYVGLPGDAPQSFGRFLRERLFDKLPVGAVHLLDGTADADAECVRYGELLRDNPVDIVCMGIGENGHIAFNDPPVADFDDPLAVKPVELDEACRMQQVHDECFATLDDVPTHALTLTIPALLKGKALFCVVPAKTKAQAVRDTVHGPISTACPASILRRHPSAALYLDGDSGALL